MRFIRCLSICLFAAGFSLACTSESSLSGAQSSASGAVETEDQRILYTLGQILGDNVGNVGLTEEELSTVLFGVSDSVLGRESQVDLDLYGPILQTFMQQRIEAAAESELAEATAFVDAQAAVDGAVRTDSGIVIQEMTVGSGVSPTAADTVSVHYHGTLRDGSIFDSSVDRGEPATFPLNGVIPCWTEGVQTLRVGGKSRLICPPDLAYGPAGRPGIPGNAVLVFEVELLGIE